MKKPSTYPTITPRRLAKIIAKEDIQRSRENGLGGNGSEWEKELWKARIAAQHQISRVSLLLNQLNQ